MKIKVLLYLIILLAGLLRIFGLNWDQGFLLHPDERQIVMVTTRINFSALGEGSLNPHFFAYGNFPIYLLKLSGNLASIVDNTFAQYEKINLIGRTISVLADLGTIFVIFLIGRKLFNQKVGLITSLLYGLSVFPIQAAHFYAVDTLLTFFIVATLYRLLIFYENPTKINALSIGFLFGLSLATKTSALILVISFAAALAIDFLLIFLKQPHHPHIWLPHIPKFLKRLLVEGAVIVIITVITFILFEPYALLDFKEFWRQTLEQSQMTGDAFTFPYTLQYVGKIPYLHELKNLFLWGQGPILATLSFLGIFYFTFRLIRKVDIKWAQELILLSFIFTYFLVVGKFAIGFMRYMLPLYPFFSLFAAVVTYQLVISIRKKLGYWVIGLLVVLGIGSMLAWPLSFMHIYTKPNTRVLASNWINKNIPQGSTLAIEHWDDGLPLFGQQNYQIIALPLYDPDTNQKWQMINQKLVQTDYIIIASNRLYIPLQKLTNCQKLPPGKCYPLTALYYQNLFNGSLGFQKVAEFSMYPKLEVGSWKLVVNDQSADESFTVYDHPKVIIFKKMVQ